MFETIMSRIRQFNSERNWEQFHDGKNLALSVSIEASELNEVFLWKKSEEADVERIKEELADVFIYSFMLADKYHFDIEEICMAKIDKNEANYPVSKSKGNNKKHNEFND